jgi:hypothetical protein
MFFDMLALTKITATAAKDATSTAIGREPMGEAGHLRDDTPGARDGIDLHGLARGQPLDI